MLVMLLMLIVRVIELFRRLSLNCDPLLVGLIIGKWYLLLWGRCVDSLMTHVKAPNLLVDRGRTWLRILTT